MSLPDHFTRRKDGRAGDMAQDDGPRQPARLDWFKIAFWTCASIAPFAFWLGVFLLAAMVWGVVMANGFNREAAIRHCIIPDALERLAGLDRVAEVLAQGGDTRAIMEICGYKDRSSANAQVQVVRRKLGWQAQ